jgi:hypothetical protein
VTLTGGNSQGDHGRRTIRLLVLFLALSVALNIAIGAGILACAGGMAVVPSIFTGAGVGGGVLTLFFTAWSIFK